MDNKIYTKTVMLPIKVAYGDCCFGDDRICPHFDNTGGCMECQLGFYPLTRDKNGQVMKPQECLVLEPTGK